MHKVFQRAVPGSCCLNDPGVIFCNRVTNYMKEKIEKAQYHIVVSMGTKDQSFEVSCKDGTGQGVRRQRDHLGLLDNAGR